MGQKMTEVGGVPRFFSYTGTATSGPAAVTVTTPHGFLPTYVRMTDGTATNPLMYEWFYGMPAASAIKTTATTGAITYIDANGITVASGTVTLGTGVLAASVVYSAVMFMASEVLDAGGVPMFFSATGTSAGTEAAVTVATPKGFYPDWVIAVDNYAGGASNDAATKTEWFKGMVSGKALTIAANGDRSISTDGITVADGSIILGVDCQINDGVYCVFAGRFSQISNVDVGGTPITFGYSGQTAASEAAVTITTPDGYFPDWVYVVDNRLETGSTTTEWFVGRANPGAILTSSAGVRSLLTSTGITPASGSIIIGTGCQVNSKYYSVFSARYSL